jgi:hypothetical protein
MFRAIYKKLKKLNFDKYEISSLKSRLVFKAEGIEIGRRGM